MLIYRHFTIHVGPYICICGRHIRVIVILIMIDQRKSQHWNFVECVLDIYWKFLRLDFRHPDLYLLPLLLWIIGAYHGYGMCIHRSTVYMAMFSVLLFYVHAERSHRLSGSNMSFEIPPGLTAMLQDFTVAVLRQKPPDLYKFAAEHFNNLYAQKRGSAAPGGGTPDSESKRRDSRKSKDAHGGYGSREGSRGGSSDLSSRETSPGNSIIITIIIIILIIIIIIINKRFIQKRTPFGGADKVSDNIFARKVQF